MYGKNDVTRILGEMNEGKSGAVEKLMPLVYDELRGLAKKYMSRERSGHTLQATALVNEAFIKLADVDNIDWQSRNHFFALSASTMRRILVDHARKKTADKRGGAGLDLEFDEELLREQEKEKSIIALDDALNLLKDRSERQASIVEMRFFGGMTMDEIAQHLGCSKRKVEGEWTLIKAWLKRELT